MNKLLLLFIFFFIASCSNESVSDESDFVTQLFSEVYLSDDLHLYVNRRDNPITGNYTSTFDDGKPQADLTFKNGMIENGFILNEMGEKWITFSLDDGNFKQVMISGDGEKLISESLYGKNLEDRLGFNIWYDDGTPYVKSDRTVYKMWHKNGQLASEVPLNDGKMHGTGIGWHENGEIASKGNFKNDQLHGLFKSWDEHGNLISERIYEMGMPQGHQKTWDNDGNLIEEKFYDHGKPHGTHRKWDTDGKLVHEYVFEMGTLISEGI